MFSILSAWVNLKTLKLNLCTGFLVWRNVWMGLTERWPALWVTAVFYKALMQTWDSSEWPEWTTTFPEWMECQAEHRAWSWRVQAPYWCFTRCTAVNNALPGPTPQLLLFLWLKKKKAFYILQKFPKTAPETLGILYQTLSGRRYTRELLYFWISRFSPSVQV